MTIGIKLTEAEQSVRKLLKEDGEGGGPEEKLILEKVAITCSDFVDREAIYMGTWKFDRDMFTDRYIAQFKTHFWGERLEVGNTDCYCPHCHKELDIQVERGAAYPELKKHFPDIKYTGYEMIIPLPKNDTEDD